MLAKRIRRILIEKDARDYPMARRILARLPQVPVEVIEDRRVLEAPEHERARWLPAAKRTLLLAVQKGPFRRPCPGTRDYICCGYQVLQVALNCPMDCTYCVLQGYLNVPAITIFVNVEDLLAELERDLDKEAAANPEMVWRLGTGEFGDSLALDAVMGLNQRLIPWFKGRWQAFLEIKSKRTEIEALLPLGPNPQVVFAWSLNPAEVIRAEEGLASPLAARLQAARAAAAAGFRLAFHFDPLIYFPGWEEAYRRTVAALGDAVPAPSIAWISLGGLRFMPSLRPLINQRFPRTQIASQEMVRAPDGKLRYFKGIRLEMYGRMRQYLSEATPGTHLYLCMESPRVWREVFGLIPTTVELSRRLDRQVFSTD
ncbi:MAG: DNA photolyase [Deltaproteobacteria bacterium]|nr:DNA photolyase [Deltaproteobacteria bacterium]